MFFSTLIFVIAFLPLFTMRGVEGAIFSPMSHTYAYALGVAILLAVTLSPVLSSYLVRTRTSAKRTIRVWEAFRGFYHWLFVRVLNWPRLTLAVIDPDHRVAVLSSFRSLGGEFLPKLEEGNIWARATMPLTISLDHGAELTNRMRGVFLSFPGSYQRRLATRTSRRRHRDHRLLQYRIFGRPQAASRNGRDGLTKPKLVDQMDASWTANFPASVSATRQNIEDNIDEALSGVKGTRFGQGLRRRPGAR